MPLFFIHIHNGGDPQIDDTGSNFGDDRLAVGAAATMAGEIWRDEARDGIEDRTLRLLVEGDDHRPVAEVVLSVTGTNLR